MSHQLQLDFLPLMLVHVFSNAFINKTTRHSTRLPANQRPVSCIICLPYIFACSRVILGSTAEVNIKISSLVF